MDVVLLVVLSLFLGYYLGKGAAKGKAYRVARADVQAVVTAKDDLIKELYVSVDYWRTRARGEKNAA